MGACHQRGGFLDRDHEHERGRETGEQQHEPCGHWAPAIPPFLRATISKVLCERLTFVRNVGCEVRECPLPAPARRHGLWLDCLHASRAWSLVGGSGGSVNLLEHLFSDKPYLIQSNSSGCARILSHETFFSISQCENASRAFVGVLMRGEWLVRASGM